MKKDLIAGLLICSCLLPAAAQAAEITGSYGTIEAAGEVKASAKDTVGMLSLKPEDTITIRLTNVTNEYVTILSCREGAAEVDNTSVQFVDQLVPEDGAVSVTYQIRDLQDQIADGEDVYSLRINQGDGEPVALYYKVGDVASANAKIEPGAGGVNYMGIKKFTETTDGLYDNTYSAGYVANISGEYGPLDLTSLTVEFTASYNGQNSTKEIKFGDVAVEGGVSVLCGLTIYNIPDEETAKDITVTAKVK